MGKKYWLLLIPLIFSLKLHPLVSDTNFFTQKITYSIGSLDVISISSSPEPLRIYTAKPGFFPQIAINNLTTYAVTTNNKSRKITAALSKSLPPGVLLRVHFTPPNGATSYGDVPLSTVPATLVTSISNTAQASLAITYILSATPEAKKVTSDTNTVSYTIGP